MRENCACAYNEQPVKTQKKLPAVKKVVQHAHRTPGNAWEGLWWYDDIARSVLA
jgi:hypothetical protein